MGLPVPSAEESDRYCQLKENFADPTMLEIAPFRVPQMVAISLDLHLELTMPPLGVTRLSGTPITLATSSIENFRSLDFYGIF